jgi:Family of unknown function (DUF6876)
VATKVLSSAQGGSATLTYDDGNGNIVFTKDIEHTEFPLDEIKLYFANNGLAPDDETHMSAIG